LENDKRRREYDDYGDVNNRNNGGGNPFRGGGYDFDMSDFDMSEDIYDIFTQAMGRRDQGVGRDIKVKLRLSFLDAVNGCNKDVKYETTVNQFNQKKGPNKKKSANVRMAKSVNIDIPAGVEEVSDSRCCNRAHMNKSIQIFKCM
jgi:DnaJ-class molecular chaperone